MWFAPRKEEAILYGVKNFKTSIFLKINRVVFDFQFLYTHPTN